MKTNESLIIPNESAASMPQYAGTLPSERDTQATPEPHNAIPASDQAAIDNYLVICAAPTLNDDHGASFLSSNEDRVNFTVRERYNCSLLMPFNYTLAYHDLKTKASLLDYSNSSLSILAIMIDEDAKQSRNSELDSVNVEVSLYRLLLEYERYLRSVTIPTALWRKSGQLILGNLSFKNLFRSISVKDMLDIFTESSITKYWERYIPIAHDISQRTILTSVLLKATADGRAAYSASFTIRRDVYGIPFLIVTQFIPANA